MGLEEPKTRRKVFRFAQSGLIVVNVIMFVGGIVLLGISVWALNESRGFFAYGLYMTAASVLLLISIIVLFVSLLGIIGAKNLVRSFITTFIIFQVILLLLIILMAAAALVFRDQLSTALRAQIYESAVEYFDSEFVTDSWDTLQKRFKCCGMVYPVGSFTVKPYQMWQVNALFMTSNGPRVPESCCNNDMITIADNYQQYRIQCQGNLQNIYEDDCYVKWKQFMEPRSEGIAFSGFVLALFAIIGIIFASLLFRSVQMEANDLKVVRESRRTHGQDERLGNRTAIFKTSRRIAPVTKLPVIEDQDFSWKHGSVNSTPPKSFGRRILVTDQCLVNQRMRNEAKNADTMQAYQRMNADNFRTVGETLSNRALRLQTSAHHIQPRPPWQ